MKPLLIGIVLLTVTAAFALDRIEAKRGSVSVSGQMSGATDFQFGVQVRGTQEQKIEQLERELRLLRFAKDSFPDLSLEINYSGTNKSLSQCIIDLSARIGKSIPMEVVNNEFVAKEFVFEGIPLVDALKYLVAFGDAILDVNGDKLVCRPVRQALVLNESEYDLLHLMAMQRFEDVIRVLDQKSVNVKDVKDSDGQNLLHLAARRNQTSIAKRLIALGVNINDKDGVGYTPLHEAVRFGNKKCAELLLGNGADVTIADNNNDTVLETAIYFGFLDIAKMLVEKGASADIFTASGIGMIDTVREFLDRGVDYKAETQDYIRKNLEKGKVIIRTLSTDPMRRSPGSYFGIYDVTPLHWAARGGSVEMVSLLISRGESVFVKNSMGETPLFWAVEKGRLEAAEFLVKQGANVDVANTRGSTPLLTTARMADSPELIEFLIKAGANVNAKDQGGENALHKLAWLGSPKTKTAQLLLDAGADITARNKDGKTPLDVLLENSLRNDDLVGLYRKYVAKVSATGRGS